MTGPRVVIVGLGDTGVLTGTRLGRDADVDADEELRPRRAQVATRARAMLPTGTERAILHG
ncbi:hypothetical protein C5E45_02450 [Nocardia nova]|uniref:Uncharacterized protein n=1 Tax=Nocardia nova TaxID=37330 RepID=A0A2S6AXP3_9NOCA|nr:hypothetical protein [Nocardia nova]PPJ34214.1 hypothetical protein C5E41_01050 [Nocardia nova]PPJ39978.1 hypothetical protein C5E45_02450 [Nocardia nova]